MTKTLDSVDHIAIQVENITRAVSWYVGEFSADILYQDDTWAFLQFANIKLALVAPTEHPFHFAILRDDAARFGTPTKHRDGTESVYIKDCEGNTLEVMKA